METGYNEEYIKRLIHEELPKIIREHPEVKVELLNILSGQFAPKEQTEDRFEKILREIQVDREEFRKRFEESDRRFEEFRKRCEEYDRRFEEHERRFKEHSRRFEEQQAEIRALREESNRRFEEVQAEIRALREDTRKRFEEHDRRFEEHSRRFEELLKEIRRVDRRIDRTIGALGARWGISTEHAFREAMKSVVEELTGYKVDRYVGYDRDGKVFGWPDSSPEDMNQ